MPENNQDLEALLESQQAEQKKGETKAAQDGIAVVETEDDQGLGLPPLPEITIPLIGKALVAKPKDDIKPREVFCIYHIALVAATNPQQPFDYEGYIKENGIQRHFEMRVKRQGQSQA